MIQELENYIKNTAEIRGLSSPQLYSVGYASEYSQLLRKNFLHIGELARENRSILDRHLFPFLRGEEIIEEAQLDSLGEFTDALLDAYNLENLDPSILAIVSRKLLDHATETGDEEETVMALDREVMACYTMVNIMGRLYPFPEVADGWRKRGMKAGAQILSYLEHDRFAALSMKLREILMINARYIWVLYEGAKLSEEEAQNNFDKLEWVFKISEDPFYREMLPDYNWRNHRFRTLQYMAIAMENHNMRGFPKEILKKFSKYVEMLTDIWDSDPEYYVKLATRDEVETIVTRSLFESGQMDVETYHEHLLDLYARRDVADYDLSGMIANLNIPAEYMLTMNRDLISEVELTLQEHFCHDVLNYAFQMPNSGSLSYMLEYVSALLHIFVELPGMFSFEDMCLNCLAALHPPTYVHSMMVGDLTRCLTRHLLRKHPELFADMPEAGHDDAIVSFAWHAAICHDVGKIMMIDTIFVYGRNLLDEEFGLIRRHPDMGAEMLAAHESTRRYANVARGHHKWYDGRGGYPDTFDASACPERAIISIVTCADCLDAATDSVGRSYNRGKTADDFLEELKAGSGTRYAPYLAELFEDPAVRRDIDFLLEQGRSANYSKTYLLLRDLQEKGTLEKDVDIRTHIEVNTYNAGDRVIEEGDAGNCMFEVRRGRVGLYGAYGTPDETLLTEVSEEGVFGEMAMLDESVRTATAVVMEDNTEIACITWPVFEMYFKNRPARVVQIMRQASERLRNTTKRERTANNRLRRIADCAQKGDLEEIRAILKEEGHA